MSQGLSKVRLVVVVVVVMTAFRVKGHSSIAMWRNTWTEHKRIIMQWDRHIKKLASLWYFVNESICFDTSSILTYFRVNRSHAKYVRLWLAVLVTSLGTLKSSHSKSRPELMIKSLSLIIRNYIADYFAFYIYKAVYSFISRSSGFFLLMGVRSPDFSFHNPW